jgi:GntR family transcriptional regulator
MTGRTALQTAVFRINRRSYVREQGTSLGTDKSRRLLFKKLMPVSIIPRQSLPGERILMEQFGVSRITIRQAIGDLVNEGILYRKHGKGTYVAEKKIEKPLGRLLGIAEELAVENNEIAISVLESKIITPAAEISKALELSPGQSVFMVKRLITTQRIPLVIICDYISDTIKYVFDDCLLDRNIFYARLEACGYKIGHGEQRIGAAAATPEEAKLLKYPKEAPVLVVRRTTYDPGHTPLIYSQITYRGDRYEYSIRLKRSPNFQD